MALIESILVIIVVVIILVILFNIFFTKSNLLITGLVPANQTTIIDASKLPSNISSNFAWSIWFFINDWNTNYGSPKALFYQASAQDVWMNNNIKVYFDDFENNLVIGIRTFESLLQKQARASASTSLGADIGAGTSQAGGVGTDLGGGGSGIGGCSGTEFGCCSDEITAATSQDDPCKGGAEPNTFIIPNMDLQKWVNLIISVEGRTLDVYLHGKLVRTFVLPNTVYLESENVYVGDNTNYFNGHIGRLQYFANSVNPQQAYNIYRDGINSNLISDFFNKYRLKLQFMEYSTDVGKPIII